jgi:hypothetical protein
MRLTDTLQDLDIEESGPLACMLDQLQTEGVSTDDARAFATWVEATIQKLQDERDEYKQLYRDLRDEYPQSMPREGKLYHPTQDEARKVAQELEDDPRVAATRIQLEPYNGWVVQVLAKPADLSDLANIADVVDGRERPGRTGKAKPSVPALTRPERAGQGGTGAKGGDGTQGGGTAPVRGATAQVWAIADTFLNEKGRADRTAIIGLCTAAGINAATAGTQYSKWKKARGVA